MENKILLYLDNELSGEQRSEFLKEMKTSEEFSNMVDKIRNIYHTIQDEKKIKEDPYFYTRLKEKLQTNSDSPIPGTWLNPAYFLRLSLAAITIILGIFVGVNVGFIGYNNSGIPNQLINDELLDESTYLNEIDLEPIESALLADNNE